MAVRPRSCAAGNREGRAPARPMANSLDLLDSYYLQNIQKTNTLSHRPMDFKLPHDVISTCAKRDEPQADGDLSRLMDDVCEAFRFFRIFNGRQKFM